MTSKTRTESWVVNVPYQNFAARLLEENTRNSCIGMAAPQTYTAQGQGALPSGTTQYVAQQPAVYPTQPYVQQQPGVYPAAPHAQQQPRAIIITQPTFTAEATIYQTYRTEAAKRLGGVQIAAGGLSTICTVIGILINVVHGSYYHGTGIPFYVAPGIWCGAIVRIL